LIDTSSTLLLYRVVADPMGGADGYPNIHCVGSHGSAWRGDAAVPACSAASGL
jgi:hypothetical protein